MASDEPAGGDKGPPNYLKAWRLHRGMTQAQVQQKLGWAEGRLSKLESGVVSSRKPETLRGLARVYGCEIGDLFGPPPQAGSGLFGILEMRRRIARLQKDIAELKAAVLPRIDAIEGQVAEAGLISEAAAKNAEELVELFGYYAAHPSRRQPIDESDEAQEQNPA